MYGSGVPVGTGSERVISSVNGSNQRGNKNGSEVPKDQRQITNFFSEKSEVQLLREHIDNLF